MLSNIGRAAIRRTGVGASQKSINGVYQNISHLQRVAKYNNVGSSFTLRQFSFSIVRSNATATLQAKARTAKPRTNTTTSTAKPRTKRAAPKNPVKNAVKRKRAAKPKLKAKPKKKVLTPKQKERAAKQKQTTELKALKAMALTPPKGKPASVWSVVLQEMTSKSAGQKDLGSLSKEASAKYKSLTAGELEHYNQLANQNKTENEIAYKKFINSHKPEEIRLANNARHQLAKRNGGKKGSTQHSNLRDPRIPKLPRRAWMIFGLDRWSSGDLKGMKVSEATPLISKEWKDLSPSQRKPYEDQEATESTRYVQEYKSVFGRDPEFVKRATAA